MNYLNTIDANATTVLSTDVAEFVLRYKGFLKQTAESIVNLAIVINEAKTTLQESRFIYFCEEVGLNHKSSTVKKMIAIGERASRFTPIMERLPNTWTTIYKLAALSPDKFDLIVRDHKDVLSPFVTAKQINEITGVSRVVKTSSEKNANSATINFSTLNVTKKSELVDRLNQLKDEFGIELSITGNEVARG